jgi:hypothetical protein
VKTDYSGRIYFIKRPAVQADGGIENQVLVEDEGGSRNLNILKQ